MAEIGGIKQSLVQTQALEGLQEAARRRGDQQQQSFAVTLDRHVDTREHQVNEGEAPVDEEELDPNAQQEKDTDSSGPKRGVVDEAAPPPLEGDDEGIGRHVDTRA